MGVKASFRAGLLGLAMAAGGWALPDGAHVIHGDVRVQSTTAGLEILQGSSQAIVQWNGFSIGPAELVRFFQPGSQATILNRVVGTDPSLIQGLLQANGRVFLVNPNGILFGPGSVVDAGSFVASTLDLSDQDFLAGRFSFRQDLSHGLTAIVNQGTIRVSDGGFLVLASPLVHNDGLLVARQGTVALEAGRAATLSFDDRGLLQFVLPDRAQTQDGTVLVTPGQASEVLAGVVGRPVEEAESLRLPRAEGVLVHSGSLDVGSGRALLDSSHATVLSNASRLDAPQGDVVVLSGGRTLSGGQITAPGGKVEVSGNYVGLSRAPVAASLLIDPGNITIVDGPSGTGTLDLNPAFPLITQAVGGPNETVSVGALTASFTILLEATNDVTYANPSGIIQFPGVAHLTVTAGRDLDLGANSQLLAPSGGSDLTLNAGRDLQVGRVVSGGTVALSAGGDMRLGGLVSAGNSLTASAGGRLEGLTPSAQLSAFSGMQVEAANIFGAGPTHELVFQSAGPVEVSVTGPDDSVLGAAAILRNAPGTVISPLLVGPSTGRVLVDGAVVYAPPAPPSSSQTVEQLREPSRDLLTDEQLAELTAQTASSQVELGNLASNSRSLPNRNAGQLWHRDPALAGLAPFAPLAPTMATVLLLPGDDTQPWDWMEEVTDSVVDSEIREKHFWREILERFILWED